METLLKINKKLRKVEEALVAGLILFMAILLIGNVIGRVIFKHSWTFAEELGSFLIIATTYTGAIYAVREGKHINMGALIDMSKHKYQKILVLFGNFVSFTGLFFVAYLTLQYMLKVIERGRTTPALGIQMWIVVLPIVFGLFMTAIQYLIQFILNIMDKDEVYIGSERKLSDGYIETE